MPAIGLFLACAHSGAFAADKSLFYFDITDGSTKTAVHFFVTDAVGRRTGKLPGGGNIKEIPGSSYATESIDSLEGSDYGEQGSFFHLRPAGSNPYLITVHSIGATSYALTLLANDQSGRTVPASTRTFHGSIAAGATQQIQVLFDPAGGGIGYKPIINIGALTSMAVGACDRATLNGNARVRGPLNANGDLHISGNATIEGDVRASTVRISGSGRITGPISESTGSLNCLPVDLVLVRQILETTNNNESIPPGYLSGGTLRVGGSDVLALPGGSYIVDRVELSGKGKISFGGDVSLFVRQSIAMAGASEINGTGSAPLNLLIDSDADHAFTVGLLRANIYAPMAKISIGGQVTVNGGIHARAVEMTGNASVEAP